MSDSRINFEVVDKLFPFNLVVSKEGRLISTGRSLSKMLPASEGRDIEDFFLITRPNGVNFKKLLIECPDEVVHVKSKFNGATFAAQPIRAFKDSEASLLVMNLIVQDADELSGLSLDFGDFAMQDPIFDYLMLLQTQKRAIRMADESNKKLAEAHRVAVAASETKSRFLANMSHELRTPMNGIVAMASILQETNLNEEQVDYLQTIVKSSEAMLGLINDILDLAKIEAGFITVSQVNFSIRDFIAELKSELAGISSRKQIDFLINIDEKVPTLFHSDPTRLRQVLVNLLGNAFKFTEKGAVGLNLSITQSGLVDIEVKDSGIGMSAETVSKIFSPFVQGDDSMTKKYEGTGLGLTITKKLVEALGGTIKVKSSLGEGSTFTVTINPGGA